MNSKTFLAILVVAIIWGTTFLGIKIGVETVPPWFVAGLRQFTAASILFFILLFTKKLKWVGFKNFKIQIVLSSLMLIGGNGLTTVAEQNLSSSLTSLISALSPVFIFASSLIVGLEKFTFRSLTGLLLGFSGIIFIFWDGFSDLKNPKYLFGIAILFLSLLSWSIGAIYAKKIHGQNQNIFLNLFYQFAFAGVAQIFLGFLFSGNIDIQKWSFQSVSAILYLAIFGSLITFYAYYFLLRKLLPTQISILSYVNTIIAIFLGWLILNEPVSMKFIVATISIIGGVFIMNYRKM
ncbi:MAG: EamA family transporter [Flavobacteriaceae bacterium]|nr:EamA family transporter [Flavobacteriaceae bacterium]